MKQHFHLKLMAAGVGAAALILAGCSGGSGDSSVNTPVTSPSAQVSSISGTAATGAALANAPVAITNSAGNSPCVEASISTTDLGSYTCTLKSGESAPFFIVVTDPTGQNAPLVSIATQTPVAGTPLTVNATSLTTAIVAQLNNGDALGVVASRTFVAADLAAATTNVLAQLAPVLTAIGTPADYNPFTTSITAATSANTGNTADQVLDMVKVGTDPTSGKLVFSTITDPTPVLLATASSTGAPVAAPTASASDLGQAAQIAAQAFTNCFALPTAQRVLATDTTITAANGGPKVTDVATACQNIATNGSNASPAFLHNGYSAGQLFYGLLTSDTMTGAKFSVPEIMAFYPADVPNGQANDRAVLNIRYIDNAGNPGNVITVAANIPSTSTPSRPSNWWLVGNQQPVDVTVRLNIRRVEQLNPANTNINRISTFQTGIQFNVNAKGPGSINGVDSLNFARISGPGLPVNGLVYQTSVSSTQSSLDLSSKTGSLTTGNQCGNGITFNCPNLWFARTKGITGTDATTLATNQTGFVWAQTADNVDPSKFVKGARYKVELFYGSNTTTPAYTFHKTLLSDLIQATQAVNLPWNTLGPQSLAALDPNGSLAGAQTALPVDWVQNPAAQQIGGVQAVVNTTSGSFGPMRSVPKGATSAILDNVTVPAFTASSANRTLLFSHRMLDGSNKTAVYIYN